MTMTPTSQITIMIVDDDSTLLNTMRIWFELKNFKVIPLGGAYEAMKILNSQSPDIILSDIRMPQGSGIDLLKWLQDSGKKIPVILMSGFSDVSEKQALAQGATSLVAKPIDSRSLLEV